jgi:hypothetical protein
MIIRLIELGPFGSRIDRGTTEGLDDLPVGYKATGMERTPDAIIVLIEPSTKRSTIAGPLLFLSHHVVR